MRFKPGQSGNPNGRPVGSKTTVDLPVNAKRQLLQKLQERAMDGDPVAQDELFLYLLRQSA